MAALFRLVFQRAKVLNLLVHGTTLCFNVVANEKERHVGPSLLVCERGLKFSSLVLNTAIIKN